MTLRPPRDGERLIIKDRPLEFSFWPVERTTRRYGLGTRVFATDPWTIIRGAAERRCRASSKLAAFAFIEQAKDFYKAAESGATAAKPLLLYYSFMNLVKAFVLTTGQRHTINKATHGLNERLDPAPNDRELINAWLEAERTTDVNPASTSYKKNFDELNLALTNSRLPIAKFRYDLVNLMPQIVPGHRLWVEGTKKGITAERFISIEKIEYWHNVTNKEIWIKIYLFLDDLKRIDLAQNQLLIDARLNAIFERVACNDQLDGRRLICAEMRNIVSYTGRPSDEIQNLTNSVRHHFWRTVLSTKPYRKYYLYPAPTLEHPQVLPQILSIYAITFYLGSIVRYRPHHFDKILGDEFGAFIQAFLNDQPSQFIYLMASEFAEKEVTKAAIV